MGGDAGGNAGLAGLETFEQLFGGLVPQSNQELISAENSAHALHKSIWSPQGRACSHRWRWMGSSLFEIG